MNPQPTESECPLHHGTGCPSDCDRGEPIISAMAQNIVRVVEDDFMDAYRRLAASHPPSLDPPPPSGSNFDVMAVLPDGRRGYYDSGDLFASTGTTIHSRREAEDLARDCRKRHPGVRFYVVDAFYDAPWVPVLGIDGGLPRARVCDDCHCMVFGGGECPFCRDDED